VSDVVPVRDTLVQMSTKRTTPTEAVRAIHVNSRDPRVPRTRRKILDAVQAMVERQEETISVAALVKEAGVSKSSFYTHFASLDDLALTVVEDAYTQLGVGTVEARCESRQERATLVRQSFEGLVDHYVRHRPFYAAVAALPLSRTVHTHAVRAMVIDLKPSIEANPYFPSELDSHLTASMLSSAIVGFLDEWIEGGFEGTPEMLVEHLVGLMPPWYTGCTSQS